MYNITIALDPFSILLVLTNIIPTPTFLLRIPSPGIAYAYVNSWNSVYSNQWCNYVSAQVHEIGHNIGLAHSNEGSTTYADQSGMMGYSYGNESAPKMCFNAAKNNQLGWYADKTTIVTPSSATGKSVSKMDLNKMDLLMNMHTIYLLLLLSSSSSSLLWFFFSFVIFFHLSLA